MGRIREIGRIVKIEGVAAAWREIANPVIEDTCQVGGALTRAAAAPVDLDAAEALHTPTPVSCPECDRLFYSDRNLRQHIVKFHNSYTCPKCNSHFTTRKEFNEHLKTCQDYGLPMIVIESNFFKVNIVSTHNNAGRRLILVPFESSDLLEQVLGEASENVRPTMNNFIDHEKPFKMDIQVLVTFY